MTPLEQHIEVEKEVQKIGANIYDQYEPEEIDLVLNKMQDRFIDDKFRHDSHSEGFDFDQGNLDDLEKLVEKDVELPVFVDTDRKLGYSILPSNYRYRIQDRSLISKTCLNPINSNYTLFNTEDYLEEHVIEYPFHPDVLEEGNPPYSELSIVLNNNTIFDINNYPPLSAGLPEKEARFVIINLILDLLRANLPETVKGIYWESYRNKYKKETFIFILDSQANIGENRIVASNTINVESNIVDGLRVSSLNPSDEVDNRLTKSNILSKVRTLNTYHKTIWRNPISSISNNRLYVYFNDKFIPKTILLDYIRIPRKINLALDISCELKENTHTRINSLAAEFIKMTIEQGSYETKLKDNMLRIE